MSRNEKITIKLKYAKIKSLEKICLFFSKDYTAVETAKELGISRQTVNQYYKILREKIDTEFISCDTLIEKLLCKTSVIHIKYCTVYMKDIFYIEYEGKMLLIEGESSLCNKLKKFISTTLQEPLKKHKNANCARVLFNKNNNSFLVSGFLKKEDSFQGFLENRLKQFRGIKQEKLLPYIKESQVRYSFSSEVIYKKILLSFNKNITIS